MIIFKEKCTLKQAPRPLKSRNSDHKRIAAIETICDNFAAGQIVHPRQFSARMPRPIKLSETGHRFFKLKNNIVSNFLVQILFLEEKIKKISFSFTSWGIAKVVGAD